MPKLHKALTALLCMLPILLGFLLVHGPYLRFRTFFVPWHHDDFEAFWGFDGLHLWAFRPISSNFADLVGNFGEPTYYVLFAALWFAALIATQFFVMRVLQLKVGLLANLSFAGVGSLIWYSLAPSVQNLQYVGLITNSLSYFPGMVAGILALRCVDLPLFSREYITTLGLFAVFSFLTAFAKEDMAAFLGLTAIYSSYLILQKYKPGVEALSHLIFLLGVIIISYGSSILHSLIAGSPVFAGTGPYDLSGFINNSIRNIIIYLKMSWGSMTLIFGFTLAGVLVAGLSRRDNTLRSLALSLMFLVACVFALMTPYLLLPRTFDFYAMSFIPILTFSVAPTTLIAMKRGLGANHLVPWGTALVIATVAFAIFVMDMKQRRYSLDWIANVRERSLRQIEEVLHAMDFGLGECRSVTVTGVSGVLGPFFAMSDKYINRKIGRSIRWLIAVQSGTILNGWIQNRNFSGRWLYVKEIGRPPASECRLDFDPNTLRATLHRSSARGIASLEATGPEAQLLDIVAFGPNPVQVGQPFNVQPNGASAIWVRAYKNIPSGSRIRLGDSILNTLIDGPFASAEVPISIIQVAGNLPVRLVGPDGELESNIASLEVKQR
jgi:hypothetical protein